MSLTAGVSMKETPTVSVTGVDDLTLIPLGGTSPTKLELVVTEDTTFEMRRSAILEIKPPRPLASAPNGYSQARASIVWKDPLALDNGLVTVNTARLEVAYDPETNDNEIQALLDDLVQLVADTDFSNFFKKLSFA